MKKLRAPRGTTVKTVGDLKKALAKYRDDRPLTMNFVGCHSSRTISVRLRRGLGWSDGWSDGAVELRGDNE